MLRALSEALAPGGALASKALSEKGVLQLLLDLRFLHDLLSGGGAPPSGTRWVLQQQQLMGAGPWGVGCIGRWQVRGNGGGKTISPLAPLLCKVGGCCGRPGVRGMLCSGVGSLRCSGLSTILCGCACCSSTAPVLPAAPHVAALRRARRRRPAWWLPAGASWRG